MFNVIFVSSYMLYMYGDRESSQRAATSENRCKQKKHQQIKKHLHQFDSRWYKCSQHKQIKKHCKCSQHKQIKKHCKCSQHKQIHLICSAYLFWLCCEHLQRVRCQIEERVFLICSALSSLGPVYMSDKAAFIRSVYSRYRRKPLTLTLFLPLLSVSCWQTVNMHF